MSVLRCCAVAAIACLVAACWADFPLERLEGIRKDSRVEPSVDGASADTQSERVDASPVIDTALPDPDSTVDGGTCTPNEFIRCLNTQLIQLCGASGDPIAFSCGTGECSESLQRCTECDPAAPAQCNSTATPNAVIQCTFYGATTETPCATGCENGSCCPDADGDMVGSCQGDCDEDDDTVFPGQVTFFTTISKNGTWNYDCSTAPEEEFEVPDLVNCERQGNTCIGEGWETEVPFCGDPGNFVPCRRQGNQCVEDAVEQRVQGCR